MLCNEVQDKLRKFTVEKLLKAIEKIGSKFQVDDYTRLEEEETLI